MYHEPVECAFIKDGWTITDDPYVLATDYNIYADLGAEWHEILQEAKALLAELE